MNTEWDVLGTSHLERIDCVYHRTEMFLAAFEEDEEEIFLKNWQCSYWTLYLNAHVHFIVNRSLKTDNREITKIQHNGNTM